MYSSPLLALFMPHGVCFRWDPVLVWLHAGSDALIAAAYFSIPITLIAFVRRRGDLPFTGIFWMFGAFIVACGITHLFGILTIWKSAYYWEGGVKLATAAISLATAVMLVRVLPKALKIPGPAALQEMNRSLEERVKVRTEELEQANTRLRHEIAQREEAEARRLETERRMQEMQKLESLGVLAGGIAHDFNNLLTGVLGNASLMRAELGESSPHLASLQSIERASHRAADLCRQMLAYSGRGQFAVGPVHMNKLIEETTHLLSVSIAKNCVLRFNLSPAKLQVQADATQLRQIVMNLVINASEAIGKRSGVIAITTGLARVDEAYRRTFLAETEVVPGDYVFIEVSDTGEGMDAATLKRIFDPFFSTKFTGRGLGLAAVLGIVRGHNGALKVYSEPGRGSTFKLFLPCDNSAATASATPFEVPTAAPTGRGGCILVADDEETVRAVVARTLESHGYTVDLVEDGRQAVERYRADPTRYRLVLLDLTMPHLDGEETFRQLRNLHPGVRVVLMSGFNEQEAMGTFSGKGLMGFVQKPFEIGTLVKVVNDAVLAG